MPANNRWDLIRGLKGWKNPLKRRPIAEDCTNCNKIVSGGDDASKSQDVPTFHVMIPSPTSVRTIFYWKLSPRELQNMHSSIFLLRFFLGYYPNLGPFDPSKMEKTGCPEAWVSDYNSTLRNIPEESGIWGPENFWWLVKNTTASKSCAKTRLEARTYTITRFRKCGCSVFYSSDVRKNKFSRAVLPATSFAAT